MVKHDQINGGISVSTLFVFVLQLDINLWFNNLCKILKHSCNIHNRWYIRDDNAVPPKYILQPISTHLPEYIEQGDKEKQKLAKKMWWEESGSMLEAVVTAAEKALPPEEAYKFKLSGKWSSEIWRSHWDPINRNRIGGVMVGMLASSAVDRGFEPQSCQSKDYKNGICCFFTKHTALRRKSKDWLAWNQQKVSRVGWHDCCFSKLAL